MVFYKMGEISAVLCNETNQERKLGGTRER